MPTSNGQYHLPPVYLATPGDVIRANQHNIPLEDIAQGLSDRMMRDGSTPMLADLPMNGYRIRGVAAATAAGDVPRYDQVTMASAFLNSASGLALAANDLIYAVDANTAGKTTLTAFARTLLDDPDAGTMRATLGLGALAVKDQAAIAADTTGTLPVNRGGTGATTAAAARTSLEAVGYTAQTLTAPQQAQARDNIGAVAIADLPEVPVEVPLGTIMHFAATVPPSGWLVCDGTAVTALYPDLRQFLVDAGSPYGLSGADPRLPDLRGEFVRGWDGGRGVDAGRVFGAAQGDELRAHTHNVRFSSANGSAADPRFAQPGVAGNTAVTIGSEMAGGTETRPRNVALLPCIRAYASVVNVPGQADMDNILQQTQVQVDDAIGAYVPPRYYWQFTASGTWTKPAGLPDDAIVTVEMWGGGGGASRASGSSSYSSGGGGGSYLRLEMRAAELPNSVPVVVGGGGAGATVNGGAGTAGGSSSFGGFGAAPGGGGGAASSAGSGGVPQVFAQGGSYSGDWSGGRGGDGGGTGSNDGLPTLFGGGGGGGGTSSGQSDGGGSAFGGAGAVGGSSGAGQAGSAPGGGGGGTKGTVNGGDGARGEVRVRI